MKFELGKCYKHSTGKKIKIIGLAHSTFYGLGFVSENEFAEYSITGMEEENAMNFVEITNDEWMKEIIM